MAEIEENKEKPKKEHVVAYLQALRLQYLIAVQSGRKTEEVSKEITKKFVIQGSIESTKVVMKSFKASALLQTANVGSFAWRSVGPLQLVVAGTIFSAQTGINYRKYKKGIISRKEFKRRTKRSGVRQTGTVIGSSTGAAGGFIVGQLLIPLPVVGGIIGTVVGGTIGGIIGDRTSMNLYMRIERKAHESREKKLVQQLEEKKRESQLIEQEEKKK